MSARVMNRDGEYMQSDDSTGRRRSGFLAACKFAVRAYSLISPWAFAALLLYVCLRAGWGWQESPRNEEHQAETRPEEKPGNQDNQTNAPAPSPALALVADAIREGDEGRYHRALPLLRKAERLAPEMMTADACSVHGRILLSNSKYDQALEQFERALLIDHQHARSYCGRGEVYANRGWFFTRPHLTNDYTLAIERVPKHPGASEKPGEVRRFEGHTKQIIKVAVSRDGRMAASGSDDGTARLWEVATGKELHKLDHENRVYTVAFSPDGSRLLTGGDRSRVRQWDTASGKELRGFEGHAHDVTDVAFSPDGRRVLSCDWVNTVRLWDAESGKAIHTLEGHTEAVMSVAFSPDGQRGISGSMDKTIRLWDLQTGKVLRRIEGHTAAVRTVAFSPDGRRVLSGSWAEDGSVRLWEAETGRELLMRLFGLYQPLLRAWLARAGVPAADTEDLMQDVLLVVFREVANFDRRGPGVFRSWLRAILAHRVQDYFRGRHYRPQAPGGSGFLERLAELESPDSGLSGQWDREHEEHLAGMAMQRVRGEFAPATWQAFCRHVLDGRPAAEVAEELGLSLNSVLLSKSRVLKRLHKVLAGLID